MPRPMGLTERAMEAQTSIRRASRECAPLWEAAVASGNWSAMAEAKSLARTLRAAGLQARRIAGIADGIDCPDGLDMPSHGAAA